MNAAPGEAGRTTGEQVLDHYDAHPVHLALLVSTAAVLVKVAGLLIEGLPGLVLMHSVDVAALVAGIATYPHRCWHRASLTFFLLGVGLLTVGNTLVVLGALWWTYR